MRNITQQELDNTAETDRKWKYPGVTGPGWYTWNEQQNTYAPVSQTEQAENPHDFSHSGLGIGGAGHHTELTPAPTAVQMERMQKLDQQPRCRRCGGQEWTGAMFTTDPSSGLCDDCYG